MLARFARENNPGAWAIAASFEEQMLRKEGTVTEASRAESGSGARLDRRGFLGLLSVAAGGAVLGACSSGSSTSTSTSSPTAAFPLGAAAKASSKPTSVTMWHSMSYNNQTTLQKLTDAFNGSQGDVHVTLVNQNSYTDTLTLFTAGLSSGGLPDLLQMETVDLQLMIDSRSVVPAQSAIDAAHYDLSDFLRSTVNFFKVQGTQWAMPFNISSNLLYFDQNAFTKAGLDPANPPTTLAELKSACQKIVSSGTAKYGMSLKLDSAYFEQWLTLADALVVNEENGRSGRATKVVFDGAVGTSLFEWYADMLDSKLAQPTSATTYDNLLAIANGIAPICLETSAALGTIQTILAGGQYANIKLGVADTPSTTADRNGVFPGGAGLYMVSKSSPAQQDGAWQYITYLDQPAQQAQWAVGTGYIPIRQSATTLPAITQLWASQPQFKVSYEQLLDSPQNPATAGAVYGPESQVEQAIISSLTSISTGTAPGAAMTQLTSTADGIISSYNSRIGA
jgi:sn-glycerol 3-phosphate transport system substrate-binding protein